MISSTRKKTGRKIAKMALAIRYEVIDILGIAKAQVK